MGYVAGTSFPGTFEHIASGYAAGYYGYMWAKAIALDFVSVFGADLMNGEVGHRFREMILSASKPSQTCPWSRSQKCSKPRWELRLRRARFGAFSTVTPSPSKKPRTQPSWTGPTSPPPAAWRELAPRLDPDKLVFIDETGASTKMARLYGRSRRGSRCRASIPHGHWLTTTFTAALRRTALTTAPMSSRFWRRRSIPVTSW